MRFPTVFRQPLTVAGPPQEARMQRRTRGTPNLPTNIIPTNIACLKLSGKSPMDMRILPLKIKIMLESNPLKSTMLVGRLAVTTSSEATRGRRWFSADLEPCHSDPKLVNVFEPGYVYPKVSRSTSKETFTTTPYMI